MCASWIWSSISTRYVQVAGINAPLGRRSCMSRDTDQVCRIYRSTLSWTKSFSQARFKRQASRSFSHVWNTWINWSRSEPWYSDSGTVCDRCRLRTRLHWTIKAKQSFAWSFRCIGGFQTILVLFMFIFGGLFWRYQIIGIIHATTWGQCRNHGHMSTLHQVL